FVSRHCGSSIVLEVSRDFFPSLQVIGGRVTVVQGDTAVLPCKLTDTMEDLTQITWQRRTREKPSNDNFITVGPNEEPQFVNGRDDRFECIGNFNDKNGTLRLSSVTLKDEGSYMCIFTLFPSGTQKTEIPLKNILCVCVSNKVIFTILHECELICVL
uniref:Ig-like domain-containing protein n=1 Tax=Oreochromis aureus TaxID=47969 RepID=A0A668SVW9_OREAU